MKEIRAYINNFVLSRVIIALGEIPGFPGVSVSDCLGFGHDEKIGYGHDFDPLFIKKRLEIFAPDAMVEIIVSVLSKYAHTGNPGDGKLFILNVQEGLCIRTGNRGTEVV
jgi:nitrogen regulatory protein PII